MTRHTFARTAAIATLALTLTGCGSSSLFCSGSGGKAATDGTTTGGSAAGGKKYTVALITHSAPGDTFWDMVRKGAEAAARKDNITLQYSADPDGPTQGSLVQAAVDKKVNGIAVTLGKPDALKGAINNAKKAQIPVVGLNSGSDAAKQFGLQGFFGQDEKTAGEAAGERLKSAGAKQPLCIIHEQGNVGLEARCAGVKERMPSTQILYVNGNDLASVRTAIAAKLTQNSNIDWVMALQGDVAINSVAAVKSSGSKAKVATFDTNADVVNDIKDGSIQFAVDQQPYLQGYLAVDALWLYLTNGDTIGGGQPTLTGPAFVDKSNVAKVAEYAARGTR